LTAPEKPLRL